jgi:hypothetical protein
MRKPIIAAVMVSGWLGLPLLRMAHAQNVHRDPRGRFSITLPPGFKLSAQETDRTYVFELADARLIVSVAPGTTDRDRLWRTALADFTGPGVPAPPAESVSDLEVSGNPARVAWYTFESSAEGTKWSYTALLGAVVMRESGTGVVCFCLLNERAAARWGDPLREAFRSIRVPGPPVISGT